MPRETGGLIKRHCVPCLRGLEPELRAKRLLAARRFTAHSIPRFAILLGHWDGGSVVGAVGALLNKKKAAAKRRKRKVKNG